jgi:hypothetical protein
MNIYHKRVPGGHGLSVAIGRDGIVAREMTPVDGLIDNPPGSYLVIEGHYSWERYRSRVRCYSGDTGDGRMRGRLVAGAISLLGYWGGEESFINRVKDFDRAEA